MFSKFYARRDAKTNAPDRAYVKDRWTHKVIYAGTIAACQAYRDAFGDAYVEAY